MAIETTKVKFTSMNTEEVASFTGDQDATYLQDALVEFYPFLANATFVESTDEDGIKTVVFSEKLGTKGLFI